MVDKIDVLKTISIFAETPTENLVEIAPMLEEVEFESGQTIFEKGGLGDCMYIIVSGWVRVHDGERTLVYLAKQEVFGEMAVLDPEPRTASVTAMEHTRLLRLNREPLHLLMRDRSEVGLGIIRVLCRHLRARVQDLDDLRTHLEQVILPLGITLSTEKNPDRLLEMILLEAQEFCNADASTLYLRTPDDQLVFSIVNTASLNVALGGTTDKPVPFPPLKMYDESGKPNRSNIATYVALRGRSSHVPDIYNSEGFDFSDTKTFDQKNGYRSIACFTVPLKNHMGEVIGVLQLLNPQDPTTGNVIPFDSYKQLVVESMASMAAISINTQMLLRRQEKLLKFEHDVQIGRQIQADFLPKHLPALDEWEIAAHFQPAREVAGDFYDAFFLSNGWIGLIVADVVDKGVGAALFMALSRSLLRVFAERHEVLLPRIQESDEHNASASARSVEANILSVVKLTSDYIAKNHADLTMFATVFFGVLDPQNGKLTYINAGHDSPAIVNAAGEIKERLTPTGPAMGMLPDMDFDIEQTALEPGDTLMAYTDGVTDARSPAGEFFTKEGLQALLEEPAPSATALLNRVITAVQNHIADADQFDDITMMAVRRTLK
jgi:sigma-B regulation protein RsbU (phosphoserine phosphatase)